MIHVSLIHRRWHCLNMAMGIAISCHAGEVKPTEGAPLQVEDRLVLTTKDVTALDQSQLIELMGADLVWSRNAAARALADRGADSIPIFQQALANDDWRVVRSGVDGLMDVLNTANQEKNDELRTAVAATVPDLTNTLSNDHYFVRMGALKVLGKLGADAKDAVTEACRLFTDEDFMGVAPTAISTVEAIGIEYTDEKVFIEALAKAIRCSDESVRRAAASVTGKLDEKKRRQLIPDMIDALQTPIKDGYYRYQVQAKIANMLYDLGEKRVLPLTIGMLCEKGWGHSHRVENFAPVLEKFGPEAISALPLLESYVKRFEKDPKVGPKLMRAIAAIKGEDE